MGLDMYLFKMPKVKKYNFNELIEISNKISEDLDNFKTTEQYKDIEPYIKEVGECIKWFDIREKVGYWRKANAVHNWFVENVQGRNR